MPFSVRAIASVPFFGADVCAGMSDPDAAEPAPPPQPPRPAATATSTHVNQLAADERYARQLAEHYNGQANYGNDPRANAYQGRPPGRPQQQYRQYAGEEERERNFIDGLYGLLVFDSRLTSSR